jgi:hypothetical protein
MAISPKVKNQVQQENKWKELIIVAIAEERLIMREERIVNIVANQ